jgi:chorismate dehydratase
MHQRVDRVGAVSYLNAQPLVYGLEDNPRVSVVRAVPSALPDLLDRAEVDVALVPVIDTVRADRAWKICSDACIGCDGATLTVRVFSRVDPADISTLRVDGDSHTSVALASILWREKYGKAIRILPLDSDATDNLKNCEAVLLIGDKVIRPPIGLDVFSTQVDLGAAWKSLTGLPFVFAVWATPHDDVAGRVGKILSAARDAGVARADEIAADAGPKLGWPEHLAKHYLTESLRFTLTEDHRRGMELFVKLARKCDLIAATEEIVFA